MPIHVLRYDDFSAFSSSEFERQLAEIVGDLNYPVTFSAVPYALDVAMFSSHASIRLCPLPQHKIHLIRELVDQQLIEIALHGWSHISISQTRGFAEFSDTMPIETQRRLIRDGKHLLEDLFHRAVRLFVPPWNRLGNRTIEALLAEDITCVSAGYPSLWEAACPLGTPAAESLPSIPCWIDPGRTACGMRTAARWGARSENVVGTLFHDYDFLESGHTGAPLAVGTLRQLLTKLRSDPQVVPRAVGEVALAEGTAGWSRMHFHHELIQSCRASVLKRRWCQRTIGSVYWSLSGAHWTRLMSGLTALPL